MACVTDLPDTRFCSSSVTGAQPHAFIYILSIALQAVRSQRQNRDHDLQSLQGLLCGPLQKKCANSCFLFFFNF